MERLLRVLVLILLAASAARAEDEAVARFTVRFERSELRIASDLGMRLVGFVVPAANEGGQAFEAELVDPARLEACRLGPHLMHVRLDGNAGTFWRLDTTAGRAWLVEDGIFGLVGGTATLQPWAQVRPGPEGLAATVVLRDLELIYVPGKKTVSLTGSGLTLATEREIGVEAPTAWSFHVAPSIGWGGARLEVDVGARELRFGRGAASPTGVGETTALLDLPLSFWLVGGRYGAQDAEVPRLLEPAAGAQLDNGRTDFLDPLDREFRWTDVPGADSYQIVVRSRRAASAAIDEQTTRPFYREESRAHVIRRNCDGWEWKVRAFRGQTALPWSEVREFDVEPPDTDPEDGSAPHRTPGPTNGALAPRLVSPKPGDVLDNGREDGAEPLAWKFQWTRVGKASEYEIAIFHDTEYPVVRARVKGLRYRFESRTLSTFGVARTSWHWRVRGFRQGEPLPWSEATPFTIEPLDSDPPEDAPTLSSDERRLIPKLLSPKPGAVMENGRGDRRRKVAWDFKWTKVSGAEAYEIQFRRRGAAGGPKTVRTEKPAYRYELTHEIKGAACYGCTWRVRALVDEQPGAWSEVQSYDIRPGR